MGIFARFRVWTQLWRNLGGNHKFRLPLALGYSLGVISTAYSTLSLFYQLNIDIGQLVRLPFYRFFTEQVLPFLASPFTLVGWDVSPLWETLLAFSSIGAAIFSNAEFRTRWRWTKHFFRKKETGPRFNRDAVGRGLPDPPKHSLLSRIGTLGLTIVLTYSFVGLLSFSLFLILGGYFIYLDIVYLFAFLVSNFFYIGEHILQSHDRLDQPQYWGTVWFTTFFVGRRDLDQYVERFWSDFWHVESIDPKSRDWVVARNVIRQGARVVANTWWFLVLAGIFSFFINR